MKTDFLERLCCCMPLFCPYLSVCALSIYLCLTRSLLYLLYMCISLCCISVCFYIGRCQCLISNYVCGVCAYVWIFPCLCKNRADNCTPPGGVGGRTWSSPGTPKSGLHVAKRIYDSQRLQWPPALVRRKERKNPCQHGAHEAQYVLYIISRRVKWWELAVDKTRSVGSMTNVTL